MDGYKLTAVLILLPVVVVILIPTIAVFVLMKIVEVVLAILSIVVSILSKGLLMFPSAIFDAYTRMIYEIQHNTNNAQNEIDTLVKTKQNHNKNFADK